MKLRINYYYIPIYILLTSCQLLSQNTWEIIRDGKNKQVVIRDETGKDFKTLDFSSSFNINRQDPLENSSNISQQIYYSKPNAPFFIIKINFEKVIKPIQPVIQVESKSYITAYDNTGMELWRNIIYHSPRKQLSYEHIIISANDSIIVAATGLPEESLGATIRIFDKNGNMLDEIDGKRLSQTFTSFNKIKISENGQYIGLEIPANGPMNIFLYSLKTKTLIQPPINVMGARIKSINNGGETKIKLGFKDTDETKIFHIDY